MRRKVHFAQPSGTLLHAIAIIRASSSPVTLGLTGGVSRFLRLRNSETPSETRNAFFASLTV
jgi:hypothetical protein